MVPTFVMSGLSPRGRGDDSSAVAGPTKRNPATKHMHLCRPFLRKADTVALFGECFGIGVHDCQNVVLTVSFTTLPNHLNQIR